MGGGAHGGLPLGRTGRKESLLPLFFQPHLRDPASQGRIVPREWKELWGHPAAITGSARSQLYKQTQP